MAFTPQMGGTASYQTGYDQDIHDQEINDRAFNEQEVDLQKVNHRESQYSFLEYSILSSIPGSIRLLQVLPTRSADGFVQCTMWHSNIISEKYQCLSYVWGDEIRHRAILVNDQKFSCRSNLADFLDVTRVNYSGPDDTLWIDALCIDQRSPKERDHQVNQMGEIYSCATNVLAWLGRDERIVRFLRYVAYLTAISETDANSLLWRYELKLQVQGDYRAFW